MSVQQVVQHRSSSSGLPRRRFDREIGTQPESKLQSTKNSRNNKFVNGGNVRGFENHSRDRLIYISTCLIGHFVEVHLRNGTVLSGIFHAANAEKDFGIVLKMARITKEGSIRSQRPVIEAFKRPHTMIIPARDFVQVVAKDVPITSDGFLNENTQKRQDLMIDSAISQSHHVEVERELERWAPDNDDPQCPELENIFDGTWNRSWNQFETNEALFGVKSTFNEELYTTKLERGPQMRELEIEASRIAREIEREETQDLHLAEERGIHLDEDADYDEESRFSSVRRIVDNATFEEYENTALDVHNAGTFGGPVSSAINRSFSDVSRRNNEEAQGSSSCSLLDEAPSQIDAGIGIYHSDSTLATELSKNDKIRLDENQIRGHVGEKHFSKGYTDKNDFEAVQTSKSEDVQPSLKKGSKEKVGLSPTATAYAPSLYLEESKDPISESTESAGVSKVSAPTHAGNPRARSGSSVSPNSELIRADSVSNAPGLSPSSSVGSLASEKSTLNPYAKEFKLNPNAKSFTPSTSLRPHAPISEGSSFYSPNMSAVPHMHGLPVGIGIGPSFGGHQSVVYSPQAIQVQSPQAYPHPNGPLYGQQMIFGQSRPVLYMPSYPPEMPYKGRDF